MKLANSVKLGRGRPSCNIPSTNRLKNSYVLILLASTFWYGQLIVVEKLHNHFVNDCHKFQCDKSTIREG